MRIEAIEISWFRGAADAITLATDGRSMVIYGQNGAGKSSFVDAVEYVLNAGRLGHLSHEYSGKHKQRGVRNAHTPPGVHPQLKIRLADGAEVQTEITDHHVAPTDRLVDNVGMAF